ncbi:MAG TPA: hypothetical protein VMU17_05990 [Elusimicrobiota bacterium]|nr:hypothetical protein [Elusimicrobiota bacterium]
MLRSPFIALLCCSLAAGFALADPPTDPKARAVYDHDREWLSHYPASFVATNIRGRGVEYAERRQAALDLVREQRDFGVVSELMDALRQNSFLSGQICDILGDWKAKRALPLLKEVAHDKKRSDEVRDKAGQAVEKISTAPEDKPPVY